MTCCCASHFVRCLGWRCEAWKRAQSPELRPRKASSAVVNAKAKALEVSGKAKQAAKDPRLLVFLLVGGPRALVFGSLGFSALVFRFEGAARVS